MHSFDGSRLNPYPLVPADLNFTARQTPPSGAAAALSPFPSPPPAETPAGTKGGVYSFNPLSPGPVKDGFLELRKGCLERICFA